MNGSSGPGWQGPPVHVAAGALVAALRAELRQAVAYGRRTPPTDVITMLAQQMESAGVPYAATMPLLAAAYRDEKLAQEAVRGSLDHQSTLKPHLCALRRRKSGVWSPAHVKRPLSNQGALRW